MRSSDAWKQIERLASATLVVILTVALAQAGDIKGKVTGLKSVSNVVVYVDTIAGKTFEAPAQHAVMDQRHLEFVPHVLPVVKGTTVDFLNSDATLHNVFWSDIGGNKKLAHNLGTWPQGQKKSFTFDNVGSVALLCNVHPEMSGYVFVAPTPYFAVTNSAGEYEIKDVPAGKYTVKTWSEQGKPATESADVSGGMATLDIAVHR